MYSEHLTWKSVGASQVYRAACHYSDTEQETDMALRITSSRAFNRIMLFTLREVGVSQCKQPRRAKPAPANTCSEVQHML